MVWLLDSWFGIHKDIKSQNVLVHNGKVFITDFGLSLDWSSEDRSTASGVPNGFAARYVAPEALEYEVSLVCLFPSILIC